MPELRQRADIAYVCPMPMEARPLARRLSLRPRLIGGRTGYSGTVDGNEVVIVVTGMGTKLAAKATGHLLDTVAVGRVVVVGIAGAIDDGASIGLVIRPEIVIDAATTARLRPANFGGVTQAGTLWTSDELITDADVLADLRGRGVIALDMETAAVAVVCDGRGVQWSVIRAISDRAGDGIVTPEILGLNNQDGTANPGAVARYLSGNPARIGRLARLARDARRATSAAAEAAATLVAVDARARPSTKESE